MVQGGRSSLHAQTMLFQAYSCVLQCVLVCVCVCTHSCSLPLMWPISLHARVFLCAHIDVGYFPSLSVCVC